MFTAELLLPAPGNALALPDLQDELDALVRTGKRAGVNVTAAVVMPPTMEAVAERADTESVTHVIFVHPPHALHELFTSATCCSVCANKPVAPRTSLAGTSAPTLAVAADFELPDCHVPTTLRGPARPEVNASW